MSVMPSEKNAAGISADKDRKKLEGHSSNVWRKVTFLKLCIWIIWEVYILHKSMKLEPDSFNYNCINGWCWCWVYKFTFVDVVAKGQFSGSHFFGRNDWGKKLLAKKLSLPNPALIQCIGQQRPFIFGDEAFVLMKSLMRRSPGRQTKLTQKTNSIFLLIFKMYTRDLMKISIIIVLISVLSSRNGKFILMYLHILVRANNLLCSKRYIYERIACTVKLQNPYWLKDVYVSQNLL